MTAKMNNHDLQSQFIHSLQLFKEMLTIHINSIEKSIIHLLLSFNKFSQVRNHIKVTILF